MDMMRGAGRHAVLVGTLLLAAGCRERSDARNLLANSGFDAAGAAALSGWSVARWHTEAGAVAQGDGSLRRSGAAALRISHSRPNDTAVLQTLKVSPASYYRIAGWVAARPGEAGGERLSATLGVFSSWASTPDVPGDGRWAYRELWVKTAPSQTRLTVACRLGHYAGASDGSAWFDDVTATRFGALPPSVSADRVIELSPEADYDASPPLRRPVVLAAAVATCLLALWGFLRACVSRGVAPVWQAVGVFVAFSAIYALSSRGITGGPFTTEPFPLARSQFAHYVFLADAFLHGRLDVTAELYEVAVFGGRTFIMEPLFPALMMLPAVAVFGVEFYDVLFLILLGAFNVALVHRLWPRVNEYARETVVAPESEYWLTLLFGLGTAHWYLSVAGRVWHLEGVAALFCLLLAVHESLGRCRAWLVGAYLGWAYLSHPPAFFTLPFFVAAAGHRWRREGASWKDELTRWAPGAAVCGVEIILGWAVYNYVRFGDFFEAGLFAAYQSETAQRHGLMSLHHVPYNVVVNLLRFPELGREFPFFRPSAAEGFSLFLATPAFLYVLRSLRRGVLSVGSWAAIIPAQMLLLMYHTSGWTQVGHRRSLDFMPFLLILTAIGAGPRLSLLARVLIVLGILVNFTGMIWYYGLH